MNASTTRKPQALHNRSAVELLPFTGFALLGDNVLFNIYQWHMSQSPITF
jgi:hypothetical protein